MCGGGSKKRPKFGKNFTKMAKISVLLVIFFKDVTNI
jgi:hypothetical protein